MKAIPSTSSRNERVGRSEGFPERDIWFLGTLDQGSANAQSCWDAAAAAVM